MLLLTFALAVAVPLALEVLARPRLGAAWAPLRWTVLPPAGATVGALLPLNALPFAATTDMVLSLALGAVMGSLVAIQGLFTELCFSGPSEADVARTGRRSAYHGPMRV